jgi:adenine-specific DNA methylase
LFFKTLDKYYARVARLGDVPHPGGLNGILENAQNLSRGAQKLSPRSIDLVITSPPYVGAQKYIRASSLSLCWLGLSRPDALRGLEKLSIGREHYSKAEYADVIPTGVKAADTFIARVHKHYALRAHIAAKYLVEMRAALTQIARVLKTDGHLVLVAGSNTICGERFDTPKYLSEIAGECGLELKLELVDAIRARGLMTKRNKTAGVIASERVLVFRRHR